MASVPVELRADRCAHRGQVALHQVPDVVAGLARAGDPKRDAFIGPKPSRVRWLATSRIEDGAAEEHRSVPRLEDVGRSRGRTGIGLD